MKIRPATNHSAEKTDYNRYFSKKMELILSLEDRICSPVYFGMPNST